jgi:hypothetical protein
LLDSVTNTRDLANAYETLEAMLAEYVVGGTAYEGEYNGAALRAYWTGRMAEQSISLPVANWVMDHDGHALTIEAAMSRLSRPTP